MFRLTQISPNVCWLEFKTRYDLCMHFWRVSEVRECPNEELRKEMTLVGYMEWYSKEYGKGKFTYPGDWAGYNVSNEDFAHVYEHANSQLTDRNKYDTFMHYVYMFLRNTVADKSKWYLIGTKTSDLKTLEHEYAHALYYINNYYKMEQNALIGDLAQNTHLAKIQNNLSDMGYSINVFDDETQAYLATGHTSSAGTTDVLKGIPKKDVNKIVQPFIDNFEEAIQDVPIFKNRSKK